jgi:nicotinate (nicotinamide) nucleotide adenylyltransferase
MRAGTRLGFFGGSFDPPHLGHLAIARAAAEAFSLDRVLFVPTAHQPLKPAGPVASFDARLAMVELLCADDADFEASPIEAPNADGTPNFTVDTLTQLRASLGEGDEIFVLVGADAFLDLRRWREPERLLQLAEWIASTSWTTSPSPPAPRASANSCAREATAPGCCRRRSSPTSASTTSTGRKSPYCRQITLGLNLHKESHGQYR